MKQGNSSHFKKIVFNTFFQLLARSFTTIANFVLILLIANDFGSFGLGQYNKAFAFVGIFSLFIDFGINSIFLKSKKNLESIGDMILLRLLIALTVFILIQPLLFILPYNALSHIGFSSVEKSYIQLISLVLFLYAFSHSVNAVFQLKQKFNLLIWPNLVLGSTLIVLGLIGYVQHNLSFFFIATLVGQIMYILLAIYLMITKLGVSFTLKRLFQFKNTFKGKNSFAKQLFIKSLPLGATLFLNVLYVRADTMILSLFRSTNEVGIYTLAYKFFDFPLSLSFFMMNAIYPIFLQSHMENKKEFYALVKKLGSYLLIISLLITGASLIGAPLIGLIKNEFNSSILAFRILSLSYPIFFLSNFILWVIITEGKEKLIPIVYILSLFINIALNIVFIPIYGFIAAAIITVLSELVVLVALFIIFNMKIEVKEERLI